MDEELQKLLDQAYAAGANESQLQGIVDAYKSKKKSTTGGGENSQGGTQPTVQSTSVSQSASEPTAAEILNPAFGVIERQKVKKDVSPYPVTPIIDKQQGKLQKDTDELVRRSAQNEFYDAVLPTDRLGKRVIKLPNGADISVDPRTIPVSPSVIDNDPDIYVGKIRTKINNKEALTPVEQAFLKRNERPISKFTIEDETQFDDLKNANGLSIEVVQDLQIPAQLTKFAPSLAGKTFGEVANTPEGKYVQTQALKDKLLRDLRMEENKVTGATGDVIDKGRITGLKAQLEDVYELETKLARGLTKVEDNGAEATVRTDESGNNLNKFINFLTQIDGNPATISSPETIDRINQLPKEFMTGLNYIKYKEPVVFERISKYLATGQPISESQVAEITHYGLDIEKEKLQDKFINQEIDQQEYKASENDIAVRAYNNLVGNKEALRGFFSSNIAELADADNVVKEASSAGDLGGRAVNKVFGHRWNYSDEEILNYATRVARANGIDVNDGRVQDAIKYLQDNEGAMIMQNSIAKSGWTRDFAKGLAQPIRGIVSTVSDVGKSNAEIYAESRSQGNVNASEQKIKRIENSWEGTVSDVLEGTGQFVTQAGLAYVAGGGLSALGRGILGRAGVAAIEGDIALTDIGATDLIGRSLIKSKDAIGTFVTAYAQSYDNNKKAALSYTADDGTATLVANGMSFLEGATENFLSPIEVARGVGGRLFNKQATSKGLVEILTDANIVDKKSAISQFLKNTLSAGVETSKVIGTEISEELVTGLADYTTNAMLNPNSQTFKDRDLLSEVAQTAYQTGLSMVIPALVSGASAFNTNNFSKGSLLVAAQNRQMLLDDMDKRLAEGIMSQYQYNEKAQIINTAASANSDLPLKQNGSKLNSDEKVNYVFSRVSEAILEKRAAATKDAAEKNILEGKIKEQQNLRTEILKNEGTKISTDQNAEGENPQSQNTATPEAENTPPPPPPTNIADVDTLKTVKDNADGVKIGVYKNVINNGTDEDITNVLSEVAEQWYDPISREATTKNFGQKIVDAAIKQFPNQQENDNISFERVVAIEPTLNKVEANEAVNESELNDAENILYEELDRNPNAAPLIEPYILKIQNHENRTTTETVTVTEEVPVEGANATQKREVKPALEQSIGTAATITRSDGTTSNGELNVVDGNYVIQSEEGDVVVGEKAITDRDLSLPEEGVMDNPIEFDNDGNVSSVTFQTPAGDLVKITDSERALDLAIQLQAQEIGEVPDAMFNQAYETVQREIQVEVPIQRNGQAVESDTEFTAEGGNKVVDENGNPLTLYHSTFKDFESFNEGVNYFAEDENYSKEIAKTVDAGRSKDKTIRTIPVNIRAERVFELPKGGEMNGNLVNSYLKKEGFRDKYDAIKGVDLYSDNKIVYALFDKNNIKILPSANDAPVDENNITSKSDQELIDRLNFLLEQDKSNDLPSGSRGPVVNEKEAQRILNTLQKRYGINAALESMGLFGPYGQFDRNNLKITINKDTTLDELGRLSAALSPTGNISRRTVFHEYIHPFVDILSRFNGPLYDEIYKKAQEANSEDNFADVSHYRGIKQKEELVVRYLDRLSDKDVSNSLLKRFIDWLSDLFFSRKVNDVTTVEKLSVDTTAEQLYDVFKNYGNLKDDVVPIIAEKRIIEEIDFYKKQLLNKDLPKEVVESVSNIIKNLLKDLKSLDISRQQEIDLIRKELSKRGINAANTANQTTANNPIQPNEGAATQQGSEVSVSNNTTETGQGNAIPPTSVPRQSAEDLIKREISETQQKIESFNAKADKIADSLINLLTSSSTKGSVKSGLGVEEIIKGATSVIKSVYAASQNVQDAIDAGMRYFRDNWSEKELGDLPEIQVRAILSKQLASEQTAKEVADAIKKDELTYNDAVDGKSQSFIDELNKELFGDKRVNFDTDAFKKEVRRQKSFGLTRDEIISLFDSVKKTTKAQKDVIDQVFGETAQRDAIAKELQDAFKKLAQGEKPSRVMQKLSVSDVTELVNALRDGVTYKAVSNAQLESMVDYVVNSLDISKANQYIDALINNADTDIKQLLRAKMIVALQDEGNSELATKLVKDMATDATNSGRQTQSLKLAYDILGAKGSPAIRTEFARRSAEAVQEKALKMTQGYADIISEQGIEISKLNNQLHAKTQSDPLMKKIKDIINKLCNLRAK